MSLTQVFTTLKDTFPSPPTTYDAISVSSSFANSLEDPHFVENVCLEVVCSYDEEQFRRFLRFVEVHLIQVLVDLDR